MTSAPPLRFHVHPTPIGEVLIVVADAEVTATDAAASDHGSRLVTLHPLGAPLEHEIESLSRVLGAIPVMVESDPLGVRAATQLDEYFEGARRDFDLPLDWRLVHGFTRDALEAVSEIPYGETASYGEVAIMAGRPRAARAVGTACRTTPFSIIVPVHRVVRADGSLGEYGGRPDVKRFLVDLEQGRLEQGALAQTAGE